MMKKTVYLVYDRPEADNIRPERIGSRTIRKG